MACRRFAKPVQGGWRRHPFRLSASIGMPRTFRPKTGGYRKLFFSTRAALRGLAIYAVQTSLREPPCFQLGPRTPSNDPSPGPLRLVKAPSAVHPLPTGQGSIQSVGCSADHRFCGPRPFHPSETSVGRVVARTCSAGPRLLVNDHARHGRNPAPYRVRCVSYPTKSRRPQNRRSALRAFGLSLDSMK